MSLKVRRAREWLAKRSRNPRKAYPLATMAFYGPTDQLATKLAAAVIYDEDEEPGALERWIVGNHDIRRDNQVTVQLVNWMKDHEVQQVVVADGILGCPHEEGIDYPEGESCPACPFWADRDGFTGALIGDTESGDGADNSSLHRSDDLDDITITYSPHCQIVDREGVTLDVQIYRGREDGWILEVVNERGTSIVWDDLLETDEAAWAEFQRTLDDEGLAAFRDE